MRKLIHYDPKGAGNLHCDSCGYDEPGPRRELNAAMIGKPCPVCGANLLTSRDYYDTLRMFAWVDWINKWFGWLGSEESKAKGKNWHRVGVKTHNGKIEIEERK